MEHQPLRGIYIFNPEENFRTFFEHCREWGINMPILNPHLLSHPNVVNERERSNLDFCLNYPVFFDDAFLAQHPQFFALDSNGNKAHQDWLKFVCPSTPGFLAYKLKDLETLLDRYEPNTLSFDFIRNYVFWEKVKPGDDGRSIPDGCYCERCVERFREEQNCDIPRDNPAQYIKEHLWAQWGRSRSHQVTKFLNDLIDHVKKSRPFLPLYVKAVPWTLRDFDGAVINSAAQDLDAIGKLVDGIFPMTFTHMLHRNMPWKKSLIEDMHNRTGKPVYSYITLAELYRKEPLTLDFFKADTDCSLNETPEGFVLFQYEMIRSHHDKLAYLLEKIGR